MSHDQIVQLVGSVIAIFALAGVARMLKLGQSRIANEDDARRFAEEALAGFEGGRALVSGDGGAALVAGRGAIAVLKRHGAQVAVRRLVPPLRIYEAVEGATVQTGEKLFGPVVLFGITADEVRGLEAPLTLV
ncbi:MAG: hypothetical protein E7773_09410 [Sphingomonas sp.]|uniref:hypothetical protein n=1 Tax=Sphingomonas sp. TaxID=28214 RepID=UPI00120936F9|nr:hypothetical protein [Sphingomonas sp.]THD36136.1 MAG: hypothetical protein E7773_09410 [Sphingomonas sp.]